MKQYIGQNRLYVQPMPYSEVCMHMQVAGKPMGFKFDGSMAQLFLKDGEDWRPFSAPILPGEAGIYTDSDGHFISRPKPYQRDRSKQLARVTNAQAKAIYRKYQQAPDGAETYREFRARVEGTILMDSAVVLKWCGMYLAIETDGHTHS